MAAEEIDERAAVAVAEAQEARGGAAAEGLDVRFDRVHPPEPAGSGGAGRGRGEGSEGGRSGRCGGRGRFPGFCPPARARLSKKSNPNCSAATPRKWVVPSSNRSGGRHFRAFQSAAADAMEVVPPPQ